MTGRLYAMHVGIGFNSPAWTAFSAAASNKILIITHILLHT